MPSRRIDVEPYVVAADVYALPPHTGRGGWSWYTGSAGWMYRLIVESLLGVELATDKLRITPCLPATWNSFKLALSLSRNPLSNHRHESLARGPRIGGVGRRRTAARRRDPAGRGPHRPCGRRGRASPSRGSAWLKGVGPGVRHRRSARRGGTAIRPLHLCRRPAIVRDENTPRDFEVRDAGSTGGDEDEIRKRTAQDNAGSAGGGRRRGRNH